MINNTLKKLHLFTYLKQIINKYLIFILSFISKLEKKVFKNELRLNKTKLKTVLNTIVLLTW